MRLDNYLTAMSQASGISVEAMLGRSRKMDICAARHIVWHRLNKKDSWSTCRIGRAFNRDHNTIANGIRQAELYINNPSFPAEHEMVEDFNKIINEQN